MNFEDTKLFKLITGFVGFAAAWWLCSRVHLWPSGPSSVAAVAIFGFCLFGVRRFVDTVLGIAVVVVSPTKTKAAR